MRGLSAKSTPGVCRIMVSPRAAVVKNGARDLAEAPVRLYLTGGFK